MCFKIKKIGDEAKGGQGFTPGWKPQLSVRTAKKGTFNRTDIGRLLDQMKVRHKGGLKEATGYKKHLKALKKATTTPLSGTSTTLPPKTARLLSQLKFAYKDRSTSKFLKRRFKLAGASSLSTSNLSTKATLNQMKKNIAKSPFLKRRFKLAGLSSNIPISKKTKYFKAMIKTIGTFPLVNRLIPNKHRMDTSKFLKR